jgi:hypothetical protein
MVFKKSTRGRKPNAKPTNSLDIVNISRNAPTAPFLGSPAPQPALLGNVPNANLFVQVNRSPIPEQAYNGVTLASPTQNVLKNVVTANKQYPRPSPCVLVLGMQDFEIKMSERVDNGLYYVNEEMRRSYVYLSYVYRFGASHDKEDIGNICETISSEIGMNKQTIRRIIKRIPAEGPNVIKCMLGSGAKKKLDKCNAGLQAAMLALNAGTSPRMAAEICNSVNSK